MLIFHFSSFFGEIGVKGDVFEIKLSVWKFMSAEINSADIPFAVELLFCPKAWGFIFYSYKFPGILSFFCDGEKGF
jgi:hypothetical protein